MTQRGTQGPSKGIQPNKKNATSFSKDYQPDPKAVAAGVRRGKLKRTQAQKALEDAGYNPMEKLIAIAEMYFTMIANKLNWDEKEATSKELDGYLKEYTKINETLASYQSSKAPTINVDEPDEVLDVTNESVENDEPLSEQQLLEAKRAMVKGLDEKL